MLARVERIHHGDTRTDTLPCERLGTERGVREFSCGCSFRYWKVRLISNRCGSVARRLCFLVVDMGLQRLSLAAQVCAMRQECIQELLEWGGESNSCCCGILYTAVVVFVILMEDTRRMFQADLHLSADLA